MFDANDNSTQEQTPDNKDNLIKNGQIFNRLCGHWHEARPFPGFDVGNGL